MVIVVGSIARCIIFGVPRLPIRPCDERPPAMYEHFCLVPMVSVHDRYYCSSYSGIAFSGVWHITCIQREMPVIIGIHDNANCHKYCILFTMLCVLE